MTTTADEAGLLHAIRAHPAEDTPRLAYADWLDENASDGPCRDCRGIGWVQVLDDLSDYDRSPAVCDYCSGTGQVSDGRRERAEFVRVQIALSRPVANTPLSPDHERNRDPRCGCDWCLVQRHKMARDPQCACERCSLENRERSLWEGWHNRWFGWGTGTDNFGSALTPNDVDPRVRRGFVAAVRMPVAAFLDAAKDLFSTHPIERVVLTDREPDSFRDGLRHFWYVQNLVPNDIANLAVLPVPLWRLLAPAQPPTEFVARGYFTRDEAMAALSAACVAYGRDLAGLPT